MSNKSLSVVGCVLIFGGAAVSGGAPSGKMDVYFCWAAPVMILGIGMIVISWRRPGR